MSGFIAIDLGCRARLRSVWRLCRSRWHQRWLCFGVGSIGNVDLIYPVKVARLEGKRKCSRRRRDNTVIHLQIAFRLRPAADQDVNRNGARVGIVNMADFRTPSVATIATSVARCFLLALHCVVQTYDYEKTEARRHARAVH